MTGAATKRLFSPVDNASVTFFRIVFGLMMVVEIVYEFLTGNVEHVWVLPQIHFSYPGFRWLPEWPEAMMYAHFAITGVAALCVATGFYFRAAATVFALGYGYIFLIEQAAYQNHLYMFTLLGILFIFLPLNRSASLDLRLGRVRQESSTYLWVLWLLRFQVGIVYFFGGIAKLNADWFAGEPMRMWLARRADFAIIGPYVHEEWLVWFFTVSGVVFDLLIVPLLLWKKTRWPAVAAVVLFNLTNAFLFKIGPFPWVMLLATPIFLDPDWPRRLYERVRGLNPKKLPLPAEADEKPSQKKAVMVILGAWVVWQLLMPLRPFLYPNNASWSDEAHFFSWRMMLRDKNTTKAQMLIHDAVSLENQLVDPTQYMEPWQSTIMNRNPELIRQFAWFVADRARVTGQITEPRVYARVLVSLNGREPALLVDPSVNLAEQSWSIGPADWIMPAPSGPPR